MLINTQNPRNIGRDRLTNYLSQPALCAIVHQGKWMGPGKFVGLDPAEIVNEIYKSDAASCGDAEGAICNEIISIMKQGAGVGHYQLWELVFPCDWIDSRYDEITQSMVVASAENLLTEVGGHELSLPFSIQIDSTDFENLSISSTSGETIIRISLPSNGSNS